MAKAGDLGKKQPKPERARISQMRHRYQPVRCGAIAFVSEPALERRLWPF
jgi:hypothetical protein